jgi:hypothetical protein
MRPNNERTRFGRQLYTSFLSSMVTLSLSCWFSAGCAGGYRFFRRSVLLPWEKRHMHEIGSFALGRIAASIVAGRRRAVPICRFAACHAE